MKTYYFPDEEHEIDFFGCCDPICVDEKELHLLSEGWDITWEEILDQVHEATEEEKAKWGTYEA